MLHLFRFMCLLLNYALTDHAMLTGYYTIYWIYMPHTYYPIILIPQAKCCLLNMRRVWSRIHTN